MKYRIKLAYDTSVTKVVDIKREIRSITTITIGAIASWNNIVSCNIVKLFSSKMITLVLNTVSF